MKIYIFHISNIIELMYQFPDLLHIWNISTPSIPPIYITEENYEFAKPAQIVVNVEQQIHLSNEIVFALKKGSFFWII
jgi:hypothetical protein